MELTQGVNNKQTESSPRSNKRPRVENQAPSLKNPTETSFAHVFEKFQVVHLPCAIRNGILTTCKSSQTFSWRDLKSAFKKLDEIDQKSWCIENGKSGEDNASSLPSDFLEASLDDKGNDHAYCSFLVQEDEIAKKRLLEQVPLSDLPFGNQWHYGSSIWVFFGRNKSCGNKDLQGRAEHTDSVSHDGTWHYQLSGSKIWYIRPTKKLIEHMKRLGVDSFSETDSIRINCNVGDVIVINTRLWWHRTVIPQQLDPSVSYARDFYLEDQQETDNTKANRTEKEAGEMTNVDGLYASDNIGKGTIIFTEEGTTTFDDTLVT
jgi:hypothetical protein